MIATVLSLTTYLRTRAYARRLRSGRLIAASLSLTPIATATAQRGVAELSGPSAVCEPHTTDVRRLVVDGARVYVDPSSVVAQGGSVLVLGLPSYISRWDTNSGRWQVSRDSIFGALIREDGAWQAIPLPPRVRHPFAPRAAPRADGSWDVVFLELPAVFDPQTSDSVVGIWHGRLNGTEWASIERVIVPGEVQPRILQVSRLLRVGDTLTWAAPFGRGRAGGLDGTLVLERRGEGWTWRTWTWRAVWVDLFADSLGRRRLLVSHANDESDSLALRMLTISNPPRALASTNIVSSRRYHASALDHGRALVTFQVVPDDAEPFWRSATIDGQAGTVRTTMLPGQFERVSALGREWHRTMQHWVADSRTSESAQGSLVLLRKVAADSVVRTSMANPFLMPSPLIEVSSHRFLMIGPAFAPHASSEPPWTATLSVGVACRETSSR